ncbi:MAG TPA: hypothetical protein VEH04_18935 [Verrucomicrobiae bacterium]|nr:hypothetical protein [Verrucomicrobiae bacterium]
MKSILVLLTAVLSLNSPNAWAASTATARMYCLSPQFHRANGGPNNFYYMDLTSLDAGVNGELRYWGSTYTYSTWFEMEDWIFEETVGGALNLNKPSSQDLNGNGFDDFYEVSQAVSGRTSSGVYQFFGGAVETATATWNREAGTSYGTCTLNLNNFGSFTHTFQILEYTGSLTYTPGATTVTGIVSMERTESPEWTFGGVLDFVKSTVNPANQLTNQFSTWTNSWDQSYEVWEQPFVRHHPARPSAYSGFIEFLDGNLGTEQADYFLWALVIHDSNDSDGDGIPNLSDSAAVVAPKAPQLRIRNSGTNLVMTVSGDVGREHRIQSKGSATGWIDGPVFTLSTDPQEVLVPYPLASPTLWRAFAH